MKRAWTGLLIAGALQGGTMAGAERPPAAPDGRPRALQGVEIAQRLNQRVPLDLSFRDEAGRAVRLGDYFGRRPVVLALVYYECPMLCTQVLNGLAAALGAVAFDAGKEFDVVAVSFDPRETPKLAAEKKRTYVTRYGRPGAEKGWHFLTGDAPSIAALTEAVGFRYRFDSETGQFAHASAVYVLTPEGVLARYFYGIEYAPRDLRLSLVEASRGQIGSPVDQLLLYCFHYDPVEGKYGAVAMNMVRLGGVLVVIALGAFVIGSWRREKRAGTSSGSPRPHDRAETRRGTFRSPEPPGPAPTAGT